MVTEVQSVELTGQDSWVSLKRRRAGTVAKQVLGVFSWAITIVGATLAAPYNYVSQMTPGAPGLTKCHLS